MVFQIVITRCFACPKIGLRRAEGEQTRLGFWLTDQGERLNHAPVVGKENTAAER
jgi:hypothetical protein